ncbi:hypothetical protein CI610_01102 [invertebrate metagenome]|uniref:Uncharacterized protein n=1 Tax=invertebrate metagenome TaxID=1711999 RepID=A0A2H9T9P9_9ZZZZ
MKPDGLYQLALYCLAWPVDSGRDEFIPDYNFKLLLSSGREIT